MSLQTSDPGLNVIRSFEGRALRAYQDSVGVWTIGYGNTNMDPNAVKRLGKIQRGLTITPQQAEDLLVESIRLHYEPAVNKRLAPLGDKLTQSTFDAGSSFHYNTGAIAKATWPTALIQNNRPLARISINSWNKAGGNVLSGLTRRRKREWSMIDTGDYGPEGRQGPVEIGENGRPTGKQLPAPSSTNNHAAPAPTPTEQASKVIPSGPGMLKLGDVDPRVDELNHSLVKLKRMKALPVPSDHYTEATKAAVTALQETHKDLTADGVAGPATIAQVERELAMQAKGKKVGGATVLVTTAGSALAAAGYVTLKVALISGGAVALFGLIYIVIKHRTELHTLWNALRGKKVP